jgi:Flp pilus assembly protein TadD
MTFSEFMTLFYRRFLQALPVGLAILPILLTTACGKPKSESPPAAEAGGFVYWMNVGKNQYEQGQTNAIASFEKAVALQPANADAFLNLANAYLLGNRNEQALQAAKEALNLDSQSAAARYVAGCASLRLAKFEDAVKLLQECRDMDVKVNAVSFQLARAHQSLGQHAEAVELLQSVLQWEPAHPSAHYVLSQVLLRLGRNAEAEKEAQEHAAIKAQKAPQGGNPERCVYNEVRAPFVLDQPLLHGVAVTFSDNTAAAFAGAATNCRSPFGVVDINQRGQNDLFVRYGDNTFGVLFNTNGVFYPAGPKFPGIPGAACTRCLVGDLNNDRYEDVVAFSDKGVQIFKFATNGIFSDATAFAGMKNRAGLDGALVDMDLTGKLDLLLLSPTNREPRLLRNLGPMYFKDITATSGIPANLTGVRQIVVDDWNGDDLMDVIVAREGQPPQILIKERGGLLVPTNTPASWPAGIVIVTGDLNNDFRTDIVIGSSNKLVVVFGGMTNQTSLPLAIWPVTVLKLTDYDNDGWLDILAAGDGVRLWRNLGQAGFRETTQELGLDKLAKERIASVSAADFDQDGDTDLLLGLSSGGLQLLRNNGGSANHMLKLRLVGNRSNASGLGVRIEVKAASWRALRTVSELPIEIGLGKNDKPDAVKSYWSDLSLPVSFELKADPKTVWNVMEIELPTGSCPYLYVWDGSQFRFVTDILGASPLGLRVSDTRFVEADPEEFVALGDDSTFRPQAGNYVVQITEELREVLYLDEAKLVVVDHPPGTKTAPTSKMLPGRPFIPHELTTLNHPRALVRAENHLGADVTADLLEADGRFVSPTRLRGPQLRGLAEPSSVALDFGPLPVERPLVLALHGWIRFGGGMANVAASHDPGLPFPFPRLEVEVASASSAAVWKPVDTAVGVPCGKTKTILVDLAGKLPPGSRRLRLSTAFELHWDQIQLWERADNSQTKIASLPPSKTDLHWRGFSDFQNLPWYFPLTPNYANVRQEPYWRITPAGWCTRYGPVDELLAKKDNALVLLNGGDELTLTFAANTLPPKPPGCVREFFLFSVGWDKDSDFHVECGATVGPLPFHGMADQLYGKQERPAGIDDGWIEKWNTRWVGPLTLSRLKP